MTSSVFLYNLEEGDVYFIRKEFAKEFGMYRFFIVVKLDCDEDCYDPNELLSEERIEEYLWIAEDGAWYQVVADCVLVGYDGMILSINDAVAFVNEDDVGVFKFHFALQPVSNDISEMLDCMLDTELDDEEDE